MSPFRSVGGRLSLALLTVVVGVLVIVYLIVVPSYQRSLENAELRSLTSSLEHVVLPKLPTADTGLQPYVVGRQPLVNARVVVFNEFSAKGTLEPFADSSTEQEAIENDSVAVEAARQTTLARGTVSRDGQLYAEVAYPIDKRVVLLSAPLHDQLETVSVIRRRLYRRCDRDDLRDPRRLRGREPVRAPASAARGGGRADRGRGLRRAVHRRRRGRGRPAGARVRADAAADRLARPGTRRVHRERLARASHAALLAGGFLELLDEPDLDTETRDEFVAQMREQVARLTKLATDLLDLSRLDAGRLTVLSEEVDLAVLATELALEFGPRAAAAAHELAVETDDPIPARGDSARILQIGRVLVENALVHTPPGTHVRIVSAHDGGRAMLAVENDGPAIPVEAERQVFERFFRLDGRRASGSGLGLAIARELAEVMEGRIELESVQGWTRFTLVLRAETPAAKIVKTAGAPV